MATKEVEAPVPKVAMADFIRSLKCHNYTVAESKLLEQLNLWDQRLKKGAWRWKVVSAECVVPAATPCFAIESLKGSEVPINIWSSEADDWTACGTLAAPDVATMVKLAQAEDVGKTSGELTVKRNRFVVRDKLVWSPKADATATSIHILSEGGFLQEREGVVLVLLPTVYTGGNLVPENEDDTMVTVTADMVRGVALGEVLCITIPKGVSFKMKPVTSGTCIAIEYSIKTEKEDRGMDEPCHPFDDVICTDDGLTCCDVRVHEAVRTMLENQATPVAVMLRHKYDEAPASGVVDGDLELEGLDAQVVQLLRGDVDLDVELVSVLVTVAVDYSESHRSDLSRWVCPGSDDERIPREARVVVLDFDQDDASVANEGKVCEYGENPCSTSATDYYHRVCAVVKLRGGAWQTCDESSGTKKKRART